MITRRIFAAALLGILVVTAGRSEAGLVTLNFEGLAEGSDVGAHYQSLGAIFTGASILTAPDYNYTGFPPHSGVNVIESPTSGIIEVDATANTTWSNVGLYYTAADPNGLYLDAYNATGNLIATTHGANNYGMDSLLAITTGGISFVRIHDMGGFFTVDDFSFNPASTAVPEPSSIVLCGLGSFVMLAVAHRRRPRPTA